MQDARNVIRRWRSSKKGMKNNLYVILAVIKKRCQHLRRDGKKKVQAWAKRMYRGIWNSKKKSRWILHLQMHSRSWNCKNRNDCYYINDNVLWEERKQIFTKRVVNSYNVRKGWKTSICKSKTRKNLFLYCINCIMK